MYRFATSATVQRGNPYTMPVKSRKVKTSKPEAVLGLGCLGHLCLYSYYGLHEITLGAHALARS